jgi:hypothetical protein
MSFPSPAAFPPSVPGPANNAIVPSDTSIQPAQAFVDFSYQHGWVDGGNLGSPLAISFANKGVTKIADVLLYVYVFMANSHWTNLNLSGNALPTAEVDQIIANYITVGIDQEPDITSTTDLSGGTNQSPSQGAAWADAWAVSFESEVTIKFNLHGGVAVLYAPSTSNFSACAMSTVEVNALLSFLVANYLARSGSILTLAGAPAAPTGQGLIDKATLIAAGWTVTTN